MAYKLGRCSRVQRENKKRAVHQSNMYKELRQLSCYTWNVQIDSKCGSYWQESSSCWPKVKFLFFAIWKEIFQNSMSVYKQTNSSKTILVNKAQSNNTCKRELETWPLTLLSVVKVRPVGYDGNNPTSVAEWLESLELGDYTKSFLINGYTSMELVKKIWEIELINVSALPCLRLYAVIIGDVMAARKFASALKCSQWFWLFMACWLEWQ